MIRLPREIFTDILLRLPLNLILRCKRVSKQWKDFINDPEFAKAYDSNSCSGSTTLLNFQAILHCRITKPLGQEPFKLQQIRMPLELKRKRHILSNNRPKNQLLSGPSSAIACVKFADGSFPLYSLFTGSWFSAVEDTPLKQRQLSSEPWLYGFGYARCADDYKIMVAVGMRSLFWVYSFRNRGWETSEGFPYAAYDWSSTRGSRGGGAYSLNGVLHWVVRAAGDRKEVIVTYDLHSKRFGEIAVPTPSSSAENNGSSEIRIVMGKAEFNGLLESLFGSSQIDAMTLGELKGQLCLVYEMFISRRAYVWVLKENGGAGESPVWVMNEYRVKHRYTWWG